MKSVILSICLLFAHIVQADDPPEFKTYLTNTVNNDQPTRTSNTEFSCSDRIFLVVEAKGLTTDTHELTVNWKNPDDERQELTNYSFEAFPYVRIWAWIQLHGPTGAVIGQAFDPSFGMEQFIGEWHAEVSIDKKKIEELTFNVLC